MIGVALCEEIFSQALKSESPDHKIQAQFIPLLNSKIGDIGTDVCVKLAAIKKVSPYLIYQNLSARFPKELQSQCNFENGFINVRLNDLNGDTLKFNTSLPEVGLEHVILLPAPSTELRGFSYIRLISFALWQYLWLRSLAVNAVLSIPGLSLDSEKFETVLSLFKEIIIRSDTVGERVSYDSALLDVLHKVDSKKQLSVWLTSNTLQSSTFNELLNIRPDRLTIRVIHRDMLSPIDNAVDVSSFFHQERKILASLLWYLAVPVPALDIDPNIALFEERDNIPWFFTTLLKRIERLPQDLPKLDLKNAEDLSEQRELHLRLHFLSRFRELAAFQCKVEDCSFAINEFLTLTNAFINSPKLRQKLHNKCLNSSESEILTGVSRELSSIISFHERFII